MPNTDTPITLVHGAWGGAHDWRGVERILHRLGYEVRRVSLTGQGERSHLISEMNDFSTHVKDVTTMIEFEYNPDEQIYLVGHSYGGSVITAVASQMPERIKALIYVDAMMPTPRDMLSDVELHAKESSVTAGNFLMPPSGPTFWDDPSGPKDVPHQRKTMIRPRSAFPKYAEAIELPGAVIALNGPGWEEGTAFPDNKAGMVHLAQERGYYIIGKPWGHNAHRSHAEELVPVLLDAIANASSGDGVG